MATIKIIYGNTTEAYYSSTSKISTPSLVVDNGTKYYIPLFTGSAGTTVIYGDYKYTLGHLKVNGYNGALSRVKASDEFEVKLNYYYSKYNNKYTLFVKAELTKGSDCVRLYSIKTGWDTNEKTSNFGSYTSLSSANNARTCTIYVTLQSIDDRKFRYRGGATGNVNVESAIYQIYHIDSNVDDNLNGTPNAATEYVSVTVNGTSNISFY